MPAPKYLIPNSFTALSLLLGLASLAMSAEGQFELAAWMILWGTLLDKADGSAARLLKATSSFGMEFDSFADFVAFGIAPAGLIYFSLSSQGAYVGAHKVVLMLTCGAYALALAIRLARFNITPGSPSHFTGVPGTLVGAVVATGYLTWAEHGVGAAILRYAPALLIVFAGLMLSGLRLPKLKARKNKAFNVFQFSNVAAAYILGPLMLLPEYLLVLAVTYLVGGLAVGLFATEATAEADSEEEEEPREQLA